MNLQEEIDLGRQTIKADAYAMSIGEIVNLYRDRELIIRPEFQRLFRWTIDQKSRLIESIMLGIPIPSVFVMQRHDGIWEVIDGLQRLSTILEFMGELRQEETGMPLPPSKLNKTKYLKSLEGMTFEGGGDGSLSFTPGQRIAFKRSKIDMKILLPESDDKAKYELFDRLNTGGAAPTAQEVRNCQLIMRSRDMYRWLERLRSTEEFIECTGISSRQAEEQYDMELVCRFFALKNTTLEQLKALVNVDTFLTDTILDFAGSSAFDRTSEALIFQRVFALLAKVSGFESFRRYDFVRERFTGGFSVAAYEAITIGLATHLEAWENTVAEEGPDGLRQRIRSLWVNDDFRAKSGSGVGGSTRIPAIVPIGRRHFLPGS